MMCDKELIENVLIELKEKLKQFKRKTTEYYFYKGMSCGLNAAMNIKDEKDVKLVIKYLNSTYEKAKSITEEK